jgi:uncharacterized repeat protein (TIGR01451 family)
VISRLARAVMICAALVALTPALMQTASALDPADPDYWTDVGSATLYKGDTYSVSGYTVEFVDYEPETDQVYISLWRGDECLNESVQNASCTNETICDEGMMVCDLLNWNDEIIVAICNETEDDPASENPTHWDDPFIHIEIWERAKPEISLEIETNCEAYTARDSEICITTTIENEGEAILENVDITIDPGDLQATGDLTMHLSNLTVDEEKSVYARLGIPAWTSEIEGESFEIVVNATGFDEEGVRYAESASTEVLVLPRFDLTVVKTVNSHISMDQSVWVRIDLENTGQKDLEIELNDTVPAGFRLCGNESPPWRFNITPSECFRFSYHIKPERPGIFEIPGAEAKFVVGGRNVSVWSNSPAITVDGAYVIVNKTAYPTNVSLGDAVTVTLGITNTGNMDAIVDLTDVLPSGASLVSGNTTLRATLSENQMNETEYVINFSVPGSITMSPPKVALTSSGYSHVAISEMPAIEVTGSLQEASAAPSQEYGDDTAETRSRSVNVPVYEILLVICVLGVVYLIGRFR